MQELLTANGLSYGPTLPPPSRGRSGGPGDLCQGHPTGIPPSLVRVRAPLSGPAVVHNLTRGAHFLQSLDMVLRLACGDQIRARIMRSWVSRDSFDAACVLFLFTVVLFVGLAGIALLMNNG